MATGLKTLAGGIIGAAIGAYFLPVGGAAIGFSIGAAIGSQFESTTGGQKGQKLDDLRTMGASFGDPISRVYGTIKTPVQVVYSSDLKKKKHVDHEEGVEVTTFTYKVDIAFLVCEGPVDGITRMWMNSKLVWNNGGDASALDLSVSKKFADNITIYTGTETQTPDPYLEEVLGTGLVPAHRGMCYVVIKNLPLKEFYNKIPNIEVEVVKSGSATDPPRLVNDLTTSRHSQSAVEENGVIVQWAAQNVSSPSCDHVIWRTDYYGETLQKTKYRLTATGAVNGFQVFRNNYHVVYGWHGSLHTSYLFYDGDLIASRGPSWTGPFGHSAAGAYDTYDTIKIQGYYITLQDGNGLIRYVAENEKPTYNWDRAAKWTTILDNYGTGYSILPDNSSNEFFWLFRRQYSGPGSDPYWICRISIELEVLNTWAKNVSGMWTGGLTGQYVAYMDKGLFLIKPSVGYPNITLYEFDYETTDSTWTSNARTSGDAVQGVIPVGDGLGMTDTQIWSVYGTLTAGTETLQAVVEAICTDAGYGSGEIDMSGLTGTVRGYRIPSPKTARDSIEELQRCYWFDLAEIDNKLTGVMRGGSSVVTLTTDDLASHPYGTQEPDELPVERLSEYELPRTLTVNYISSDGVYEQGSQYSRRQVTQSNKDQTISVNVILSDDEAAQVSDVLLYNEYANAEIMSVDVLESFQYLTPTDLITIPDGSDSRLIRIIEEYEKHAGIIQYKAVPEHVPVYTQSRTGAASSATYNTGIDQNGPAALAYLDIPILDEIDDYDGVYLGAAGYLTTWSGHSLYKYSDITVGYNKIAAFVADAGIGTSTDKLASADTAFIDYTNTVNVWLANSDLTLTSTTEDAAILDNSINRCALGQDGTFEIMQFITATLESNGTYTLSGLIRGRRGTGYAASLHAIGDQFVMIDYTTISRISVSATDINTESTYKFVGFDQDIADVSQQYITFYDRAKQPFYPASVKAVQSGSDWVITWIPRTRLNAALISYFEIDDDPEITLHTVDIVDGSDVMQRSTDVTVGTNTWTYTSAMQTYDFGGAQTDINVVVYPYGSTYGYGYGLKLVTSTDASTIHDPKA